MISLDKKDKRGMMLSAGGFSLFAIGDAMIKLLADGGFTAPQIAFYLQLFFLPLLLLLSPWLGGLGAALKTKKLWLHVLRSLCGVGTFFLMITGFHKLGLALSYTLIFAGPFFAALLSILFLKEQVGWHRWASILCGFFGVLVVLRPGFAAMDIAALGIIFAAILYAISTVTARRIGGDEPLLAFSLFGSIISLAVYGTMTFWAGDVRIPAGDEWGLFFVISLFHVSGGLMTARAFSTTETALAAPFHYVQLLWGTIFGVLLFSTVPDLWTGLGALIIVSSGIYLIYREHVKHRDLIKGVTAHGGFDQD